MSKLPVLVSVPHGGTEVPEEVKDKVVAGSRDIFADGDPYTRQIYNVEDRVECFFSAGVARAVVDLNRSRDDLPPANPDGVLKSETIFGVPVFGDWEPWKEDSDLLKKYYDPYYKSIEAAIEEKGDKLLLGLDCHSMAAVGPAQAADAGKKRPTLCLGTLGGKSMPPAMTEKLAWMLAESLGIHPGEVAIDSPFKGGNLTQHFGQKKIPWVQIEMNRKLYLEKPWFDSRSQTMDARRLMTLNQAFYKTLADFCHFLKRKGQK